MLVVTCAVASVGVLKVVPRAGAEPAGRESWSMSKPAETQATLEALGIWTPLAQALVEFEGRCAYCDRDLVSTRLGYACAETDHLLSQAKYRVVKDHPRNWVLACSICNSAKQGWTPAGDLYTGDERRGTKNAKAALENPSDRSRLIQEAKEYVKETVIERNWTGEWKEVRRIMHGRCDS